MPKIEVTEFYSDWYGCQVLNLRSRKVDGKHSLEDRVATRFVWNADDDGTVEYRWDLGIVGLGGGRTMAGLGEFRTRFPAQAWVEGRSIPNHAGVQALAKDQELLTNHPIWKMVETLVHQGKPFKEALDEAVDAHPGVSTRLYGDD